MVVKAASGFAIAAMATFAMLVSWLILMLARLQPPLSTCCSTLGIVPGWGRFMMGTLSWTVASPTQALPSPSPGISTRLTLLIPLDMWTLPWRFERSMAVLDGEGWCWMDQLG